MSNFNAIPRFTLLSQLVRRRISLKTTLTAVAAIAIAAALLIGVPHSQAYANSPTPTPARALHSPADASQALRRYTLQLLHILSDADTNQWQRYRRAIEFCADAPARLAEIDAGDDVAPLDATLAGLTADLCADLERRLDEARTVGLLMNEPESMDGYTLLAGASNSDVHLIDHLGSVAHSWQLENQISHAKLLDNGNLLAQLGSGEVSSIAEVDPDSNIVWQYTHTDPLHHDFLKMSNGNVLMLMRGVKTMEEAIALGVNPDIVPSEGMQYDYLIEMRPSGSEGGDIVWEWSALDYIAQDFNPGKPNYGDPYEHPELIDANFSTARYWSNANVLAWTHINAIDYNPELDQIALSARHFSELWIIDHSATAEEAPALKGGNSGRGGALLYRWGNPRAYRHGTVADQRLFRQHHTHWIAPGLPGEGNILVFNNGYELGAYFPEYSSIEEIAPPVDGYGYRREPGAAYPPAEPVWSYTAETPTDFYSRVISGAQRLPNGNTLICEGMSGNVFQVTSDGKTVWQYVYPMDGDAPLKQGEEASLLLRLPPGGDVVLKNALYRAYWYAPDHPGLQKYDLTPGATIELYE